MKFFHLFAIVVLSVLPVWGDEAGAKRVLLEYEAEREAWVTKVNAAADVEARRELWRTVPDVDDFGQRLLHQLDSAWKKDWFLDYAPKLLELAPAFSVTPLPRVARTPLSLIRDSADRFHFESSKVGPLCMALVLDKGPTTRRFLEKVERIHPDKEVQGQAAMALALLSRELGNGGDVAQFKEQRIKWVRKAIIEASKVKFGQVTIGEIAKDFLFAISHLEKGMQAPDVLGWNVEEQALRLRDFQGKPVMIVFWHTRMEAADKTMALLRRVEEGLGRRGLKVVGVASEDRDTLRAMMKDGSITWANWVDDQGKIAQLYQVKRYPACWVLDEKGAVIFNGPPGPFAELTAEALVKGLKRK